MNHVSLGKKNASCIFQFDEGFSLPCGEISAGSSQRHKTLPWSLARVFQQASTHSGSSYLLPWNAAGFVIAALREQSRTPELSYNPPWGFYSFVLGPLLCVSPDPDKKSGYLEATMQRSQRERCQRSPSCASPRGGCVSPRSAFGEPQAGTAAFRTPATVRDRG